ncbi:MAG: hypothetical protein ABL973_06230 [Micropepsaceae bacterium]
MANTTPRHSSKTTGVVLVVVGTLMLIGLGAFVTIAVGFRESFTSSMPPLEDLVEGVALLSPVIILALLLIGYGRRLLRKE